MVRNEGRWLTAVIMSVVMLFSVLANPVCAMALDEEGEGTVPTYVNSDGEAIAVEATDDGFVYAEVNSDGEDVIKIYGYKGNEKDLVVPKQINEKNVVSFAIDPRWPLDEEEYDAIESITLPNTIQCAHSKFLNYFTGLQSVTIEDGNEKYLSLDGVLYKANYGGIEVAAYPRAKADKTFIMPEDMNEFYQFFPGNPIESIKISKPIDYISSSDLKYLTNLKSFEVSSENEWLFARDGVLFVKDYWYEEDENGDDVEVLYNSLQRYPANKEGEEYTVPDDVVEINRRAFKDVRNLKKLTLSEGTRWIAGNAFIYEYDDEQAIPSIDTIVFTAKEAPDKDDYSSFTAVKNLYNYLDGELTISCPEDGTGYEDFIAWLTDGRDEDDEQETNYWYEEPVMERETYYVGSNIVVNGEPDCGTPYAVFSNAEDGEYTTTMPSTVGTWYAKLIVDETDDYTGLESDPLQFEIIKPDPEQGQLENEWLIRPNWTEAEYGEEYDFIAVPLYGEVSYAYSEDADPDPTDPDDWKAGLPSLPGEYTIQMLVEETDDYTGLNYYGSVVITKRKVEISVSCDSVITGQTPKPTVAFEDEDDSDLLDLDDLDFIYMIEDEDDYDEYIEIDGIPTEPGYYRVKVSYESDFLDVYGSAYFRICSKAEMVEDMIYELPSVNRLSIEDKEYVEEVAAAFKALSSEERDEISEYAIEKLNKLIARMSTLEAEEQLNGKQGEYDDAVLDLEAKKKAAEQSKKAAEEAPAGEEAVAAAAQALADADAVKTAAAALKTAAEALEQATVAYSEIASDDPVLTRQQQNQAKKAVQAAADLVAEAGNAVQDAETEYQSVQTLQEEIDAAKVHNGLKHEEVEATCAKEGTKVYWECTVHENEYFSDAGCRNPIEAPEVIPKKDHQFTDLIAEVPATCTSDGVKAHYECTGCDGLFVKEGDEYKEVTAEDLKIAGGHNYGELIAEVPATCTTDGTKAHYQCSVCKAFFDADKNKTTAEALVIPGGHNYGELVPAVPATCTEDGMKAHYQCSVCEEFFDIDKNGTTAAALVITAPGHQYGELIAEVPADCENAGTKAHYQCSVCKELFDADKNKTTAEALVIPAAGHQYGDLIAEVPADCENAGTRAHYQCSVCKGLFDADKNKTTAEALVIPAAGHQYGELVPEVPATYTKDGMKAYYQCSVCKEYFDADKNKTTVEALRIPMLPQTEITKEMVKLNPTRCKFKNKEMKPSVTVTVNGQKLTKDTDFTVEYKDNKNAGTAKVTVSGIGAYKGTVEMTFKIDKAANPMNVKTKKVIIKITSTKLSAKKIVTVFKFKKKAKGKVKYSGKGIGKASKTALIINKKNGKITVKKNTKPGLYKMRLKFKAAGNSNYKAKSITKTVKIVVKQGS